MHTLDLSALLERLDGEIAEAEREVRAAQLRLAQAQGRKQGMLETIAAINEQQPVYTNGDER